jgi:hypothetical protein
MKNIPKCALLLLLTLMLPACNSSQVDPTDPCDVFEKEIVSPVPKSCRPFDSMITPRSDGVSVWVAFDCGLRDWENIRSSFGIKKRHDYYLKYATGKTPHDTGFEGYIDDDYELLRDESGRNFYVRPLRDGVRVVYFCRK